MFILIVKLKRKGFEIPVVDGRLGWICKHMIKIEYKDLGIRYLRIEERIDGQTRIFHEWFLHQGFSKIFSCFPSDYVRRIHFTPEWYLQPLRFATSTKKSEVKSSNNPIFADLKHPNFKFERK